jgi:hypothetical protein
MAIQMLWKFFRTIPTGAGGSSFSLIFNNLLKMLLYEKLCLDSNMENYPQM